MQKMFVIMTMMVLGVLVSTSQAQTLTDEQFDRAYLAQSMRWIPTDCREAHQALSGFDEQAARLRNLYPEWTREFVHDNRDTLVKRMDKLCQKNA